MRSLFIAAILLCSAATQAQTIDELDLKFGYKDIRFDMPVDSVVKATKARTSFALKTERYQYYNLPSPYTKFSDFNCGVYLVRLRETNEMYAFFLNLYDGSKATYDKLIFFFTNLYGAPTKKDDIYDKAFWQGEKVEITIEHESYPEKNSILIQNKIAEDKSEEAMKEKLDKTKTDF